LPSALINDLLMAVAALAVALFVLRPSVLRLPHWRATVTPLASIIGSGFLVTGPILGHAVGHWAWIAMAGLCAASYLFGITVRANIERAEPMLADNPPAYLRALDRAGDLALVLAYFVSIAYYLFLLSAFLLKAAGVIDPDTARWITTGLLILLAALGYTGGLRWLENVELGAVGLKLALIAGIITALLAADAANFWSGTLALRPANSVGGWEATRIVLGLVILVQGFETSRYLGRTYDGPMRVRTMHHAQWIAFVIYISFVLLLTPYLNGQLPTKGGETYIIDLIGPVGLLVAPFVLMAAVLSQLSAAVADMNGSSGLIGTASNGRITMSLAYAGTAAASIAVVWAGDIFAIINWASKAFVLFYGIEAITALMIEVRENPRPRARVLAVHGLSTLLALAVIVLGKSADG